MIRVVVAEDSATVRALLVATLESDPAVRVVGVASDGREAIELAIRLRPDLITMDVHMPYVDGIVATRAIMTQAPCPIIIVSSMASDDVQLGLTATQAGALMVLPVPTAAGSGGLATAQRQLVDMVKAMATVRVVRRRPPVAARGAGAPVAARGAAQLTRGGLRLVAIAASTGGPPALHRILEELPVGFPAPIAVVQHMAAGFVGGLAEWLGGDGRFRVKVAEPGEPLVPGGVYLAPDDRHLGVVAGRAQLSSEPAIGGFRPAATYLFSSLARDGAEGTVGVVLSGMGRDGVDGLTALHDAGGHIVGQDEASSVVYGMAREARRAGLVDRELPLAEIGPYLARLATET